MKHWRKITATAMVAASLPVSVWGSGGPPPQPDYVTYYALNPIDRVPLAIGRPGILKGKAPTPVLYLNWRALNGLSNGTATTDALATPCCDQRINTNADWIETRKLVKSQIPEINYVSTYRPAPNYTTVQTCFNDAFATAAATLRDRMQRYGAASEDVRNWVLTQDAVFSACGKLDVSLPPLPDNAPAWLRADYAYQEAALALYDGRFADAQQRFTAIAQDRQSPWQPKALYLTARTAVRRAMNEPVAEHFANAQAALDQLDAAQSGTYGQTESERLQLMLDYRKAPEALLKRLDRELSTNTPTADIAVRFKDYWSLAARAGQKPEAADWIASLQASDRAAALGHAQARWRKSRHSAWLLAALSLATPADPIAPSLARDAGRIKASDPAWLTGQYHLIRLTMDSAAEADTRRRVDALLQRSELTPSDRNIFASVRAQLSENIADFTAYIVRVPYCTDGVPECIEYNWPSGNGLIAKRGDGYVGMPGDSQAMIDRLPLSLRLELGRSENLPNEFRLDITLTNFVRAVLSSNDAATNETARALADLLPQLREDWLAIAALPSGEDKRFAATFVMTKIPSLRSDLADYSRPVGTVPEFSGAWVNWVRLRPEAPKPTLTFPMLGKYAAEDSWMTDNGDDSTENGDAGNDDKTVDLVCAGKCGAAPFVLHMPPFAAPHLASALEERVHYLTSDMIEASSAASAVSLWDDALAYVTAHPNDPRAGETLYRLIRVARWGGNPNHLGKRAFKLLHSRYPKSIWTQRSPYYYDN